MAYSINNHSNNYNIIWYQKDNSPCCTCIHIKKYGETCRKDLLKSYALVHGMFVCCIGKDSRKRKAEYCVCKAELCKTEYNRVHACLHCVYFGCFDHILEHFQSLSHLLAIDTNSGHVYCFECKDYTYDSDFEEIANQHRLIAACQRPESFIYQYVPQAKVIKCLKNFKKVSLPSSGHIGLRGIVNMYNTCYVNATLQCLIHAPVLRDYFLSDKHKCSFQGKSSTFELNDVCFPCELGKIVQEFYKGEDDPYVPRLLLYFIWKNMPHFANKESQDAQEFLVSFLNILHKHCNKNETFGEIECHHNCMIDKIFTGFLQSKTTCLNCKFVSTKIFSFKEKSLMLSKKVKYESSSPTLIDYLDGFVSAECFPDHFCTWCHSNQKYTTETKLKKLPLVLIFFLPSATTSLEFPEHLDVTPYMSYFKSSKDSSCQEGSDHNRFNKIKNMFYLFGVVSYKESKEVSNEGHKEGHYISYIKIEKNKWFLCDDHEINEVNFNDIRKHAMYILFYHKKFLEYI